MIRNGKGLIRGGSRRRCRYHVGTGFGDPLSAPRVVETVLRSGFGRHNMQQSLSMCPGGMETSRLRGFRGCKTFPLNNRDREARQAGKGGALLTSYQASLLS